MTFKDWLEDRKLKQCNKYSKTSFNIAQLESAFNAGFEAGLNSNLKETRQ